jgi:hypothetical protein
VMICGQFPLFKRFWASQRAPKPRHLPPNGVKKRVTRFFRQSDRKDL